jgi:hypothetical protein
MGEAFDEVLGWVEQSLRKARKFLFFFTADEECGREKNEDKVREESGTSRKVGHVFCLLVAIFVEEAGFASIGRRALGTAATAALFAAESTECGRARAPTAIGTGGTAGFGFANGCGAYAGCGIAGFAGGAATNLAVAGTNSFGFVAALRGFAEGGILHACFWFFALACGVVASFAGRAGVIGTAIQLDTNARWFIAFRITCRAACDIAIWAACPVAFVTHIATATRGIAGTGFLADVDAAERLALFAIGTICVATAGMTFSVTGAALFAGFALDIFAGVSLGDAFVIDTCFGPTILVIPASYAFGFEQVAVGLEGVCAVIVFVTTLVTWWILARGLRCRLRCRRRVAFGVVTG